MQLDYITSSGQDWCDASDSNPPPAILHQGRPITVAGWCVSKQTFGADANCVIFICRSWLLLMFTPFWRRFTLIKHLRAEGAIEKVEQPIHKLISRLRLIGCTFSGIFTLPVTLNRANFNIFCRVYSPFTVIAKHDCDPDQSLHSIVLIKLFSMFKYNCFTTERLRDVCLFPGTSLPSNTPSRRFKSESPPSCHSYVINPTSKQAYCKSGKQIYDVCATTTQRSRSCPPVVTLRGINVELMFVYAFMDCPVIAQNLPSISELLCAGRCHCWLFHSRFFFDNCFFNVQNMVRSSSGWSSLSASSFSSCSLFEQSKLDGVVL